MDYHLSLPLIVEAITRCLMLLCYCATVLLYYCTTVVMTVAVLLHRIRQPLSHNMRPSHATNNIIDNDSSSSSSNNSNNITATATTTTTTTLPSPPSPPPIHTYIQMFRSHLRVANTTPTKNQFFS